MRSRMIASANWMRCSSPAQPKQHFRGHDIAVHVGRKEREQVELQLPVSCEQAPDYRRLVWVPFEDFKHGVPHDR